MCKPAFKELATDLAMELITEARQKGFDYEDLAEFVGTTKLTMKAYNYGDSTPSLAVFIGIWKRAKPIGVLKKFASWSNCIVVPLPEIKNSQASTITRQISKNLKEFSEYIDQIGTAIEDGRISTEEAEKIKKEGLEAVEMIMETLKIVEEMAK